MIGLVLLGAALVLILVWFLVRPLRQTTVTAVTEEYHELQQLRERLLVQLNELDSDLADQGMDPAVAEDERLRLEAELAQALKRLENLDSSQHASAPGNVHQQWAITLLVLLLVVPALAGSVYMLHGKAVDPDQLAANANDDAGQGQQQGGVPPMVQQMVGRLEARLAQSPQDPKGWAQLGRSYLVLGRHQESLKAYATAYEQAPQDTEILVNYAMLMFQLHPGVTEGKVFELFNKLYALDPEYPGALWFLGYAAFNKGEFNKAAGYWEDTLKYLPPGSPAKAEVQRALAEARKNM